MISADTTPVAHAPFEERLKLVKERVQHLTRNTAPAKQNYHRARLWVRWINANLLSDKASEVQA